MFNRGDKFVPVGAEIRPGHEDFTNGRRKGMRTRMSRRQLRPPGAPNFTDAQKRALGFTWAAMILMLLYVGSMSLALFQPGYTFWDRVGSVMLMFGMLFILMHGLGYANSVIKASWAYREIQSHLFATAHTPKVVCIVACYNEPADVLDETIGSVSALDYANKEIVILDDSTREESRQAARDIAAKYGVQCVQRTTRRGYKAGAINDFLPQTDAQYLAIFDADALPATNFLKDIVPLIVDNPRVGFLQTPQYYANTEVSNVAMAASRQQNVFYEYICEGKSYSKAAFCCGTNVIFRRAALQDVGGFNEENVTEDFATSFEMHRNGWDSIYFNRVYVYSLAPENLAAYFMQQSRWSFGTLSTARYFLKNFLKNPRALRMGQWWEYWLSATYYWVGWVNFFFMLLPMMYIFFGIRPMRQEVFTYLAVFIPYFVFTLNMFYSGMEAKGYKIGELILGQQIGFITFPVHMTSAIAGILGRKRPFGVTPKGVGGRIPWKALWPQITMLVLSALAFVWGIYRYASGYDRNTTAVMVNSLWALYHVWMLGSIFTLNQPVREGEKGFFEDPGQERGPYLYPQPVREFVNAPRVAARLAVGSALACLGFMIWAGWQVLTWVRTPGYPVNVTIVDRTVGRDAEEHRALTWTLNYLKVQKQAGFAASPGSSYDWRTDYIGFVPGLNTRLAEDPSGQGDLLAYGSNRPLPARINTPGVMYLADTYGEFVEYDTSRREYLRYRANPRGLNPQEIDTISAFSKRGGLLIGEWNVLGYPTHPGDFAPPMVVEKSLRRERRLLMESTGALRYFTDRENALRGRPGSAALMSQFRRRREQLKDTIAKSTDLIYGLQNQLTFSAANAAQGAAARRLEDLLHVSYAGWYGRYVEDFAAEREYDYQLWKNVRNYLTDQNGGKVTDPKGPGFVFYPSGTSMALNPKTGRLQPNTFAKPIAVLEDEFSTPITNDLAVIQLSTDEAVRNDPLLRGVAPKTPGRYWFEVVRPAPGSRVLAYYKLKVDADAIARLKKAGFPAQYLAVAKNEITFPALIAHRDGGLDNGQLRSLYFAGDASDNPTISSLAERFPALGSVNTAFTGKMGSFPSQFYWGYYEPILRNVFDETERIRYRN